MKAESRHLRGSLAEELQDTTTGGIAIEQNNQLTKFHGLYMQDDRDVRNIRKKEGKEKAFGFMLRVRLPGGRATPEQWRVLDRSRDGIRARLRCASPRGRLSSFTAS